VRASDLFRNWNYAPFDSDEFMRIQAEIDEFIVGHDGSAADVAVAVAAS
jgi:hypothetical protein